MDYKNDFRYDLKVGQVGEKMLGHILNSATIEVKRDAWVCKSGNIAIEYESRAKPSGLSITEAEWWCFIVSGDMNDKMMLLIETQKLKEIARVYYIKGHIKKMGDNNTSKAVLIPFKELIKATPQPYIKMDKETKAELSRLRSENAFLKEIINTQYKNALKALNFANNSITTKTDASTKETRKQS
jgi:hypothetical protein